MTSCRPPIRARYAGMREQRAQRLPGALPRSSTRSNSGTTAAGAGDCAWRTSTASTSDGAWAIDTT